MTTAPTDDSLDPRTGDLTAFEVAWDSNPRRRPWRAGVDALLTTQARADASARTGPHRHPERRRGRLGDARDRDHRRGHGRAGSYAGLLFAVDTADPAAGALMARTEERGTAIGNEIIFVELEWAALDDARAEELLASDDLAFCRHHLAAARRYRPHLLSEPEERVLSDKALTATNAWVRLFSELTSAITVELGGETIGLEQGLSQLMSPDREARRAAAEAVTGGLAPGLRTRVRIQHAARRQVDRRPYASTELDRARNLANEASDESVQALIDAVQARADIPQRWYALKARLLGLDRLADYDRMASVAESDEEFAWSEARDLVLDAYASFSPDLANAARRFFDESWIDAPLRPAKRPGAFCAYTVPSQHPYLLLNWTARRRDVLTLAHEMGHGLHAYLAREQGVFHRARRSLSRRPRRCSARRSPSAVCWRPPATRPHASRCSPRVSRARSRRCSGRWR
jgi:oligoendopeptidase F